eukprot:CAMPEP_0114245104 /NCGR_PEP_ID=MMETSP0058-20121206/11704_1 /TAXON_ID=36894 /ORGANISM="Pyramimonas parkeae, CCMP726" /LENGTH=517 /DNA_ID=CAMNT_0001358107 /DNA_START=427 /DNA_END=1981 /DNA_ORIENTATION=-
MGEVELEIGAALKTDWGRQSVCEMVGLASHEQLMLATTSALLALLICANCISHKTEHVGWVSEAGVACALGLLGGLGVHVLYHVCGDILPPGILHFNSDLFFNVMLPPIIYNAGFNMRKRLFFRNFLSICSLGILGTLLQFALLSSAAWFIFGRQPTLGLHINFGDCLAVGAIFASTDSVVALQVIKQDKHPLLYSLAFGEGVLNDATSVVLLGAITHFSHPIDLTRGHVLAMAEVFAWLFVGSGMLGVAMGLCSALLMKHLYLGQPDPQREMVLMMATAFFAYGIAEVCGLSSIFAIFFCAITQSHYALHSASPPCQLVLKQMLGTLSNVLETLIFLYCGWSALDKSLWGSARIGKAAGLSAVVLLLLLGIRLVVVLPICMLTNTVRAHKIALPHVMILWWAGVNRGVITLALAFHQFASTSFSETKPEHATLVITSLLVVLFSTMVFGMITDGLLAALLDIVDRGQNDLDAPASQQRLALRGQTAARTDWCIGAGATWMTDSSNGSLVVVHPTVT